MIYGTLWVAEPDDVDSERLRLEEGRVAEWVPILSSGLARLAIFNGTQIRFV